MLTSSAICTRYKPDLSADNGTSGYIEPEVARSSSGSSGRRLCRAVAALSIKVEPSGYGGVLDLNAAMAELLVNSNPGVEAPCEPVMNTTYSKLAITDIH